MKTELIFFDNFNNSMDGTKRGLIAFISLIIFDLIWFSFTSNKVYNMTTRNPINIYSAIFVWLILCSALTVQLPKSYDEALVYGILVGFSIYGVFNFTNYSIFKEWSLSTAFIDTIWGTINCAIAVSIVYFIFWKK